MTQNSSVILSDNVSIPLARVVLYQIKLKLWKSKCMIVWFTSKKQKEWQVHHSFTHFMEKTKKKNVVDGLEVLLDFLDIMKAFCQVCHGRIVGLLNILTDFLNKRKGCAQRSSFFLGKCGWRSSTRIHTGSFISLNRD